MTTVAVIPVKQLENAKQRLSGRLSAVQRRDLFTAMLQDVLEAVTTCDRIDRVIVVTDDAAVANVAGAFGAQIRPEPRPAGLIEAVTDVAGALASEGVANMLFVPADVPLVSVEELEVVLDGFGKAGGPEMMIVPSHDLGGSNCVVCSPPDCMTFAFGEDSFRRHLAIARERGVATAVARLPGIGLDIDLPDDLEAVAAICEKDGLTNNTHRFLIENGVVDEHGNALKRIG